VTFKHSWGRGRNGMLLGRVQACKNETQFGKKTLGSLSLPSIPKLELVTYISLFFRLYFHVLYITV
jgi:hypothetical protein